MTAKEKLDSMDAIGYIKKFNISKADTLILSHYYKNIESKLSILTRGKYLRENIIPITKTYGISNWDRAKLGVFLIKSVLITDENFDKLLKSDKKELEKQLMLEKNKTTSSNKPSKTKTTSPKSVNTNKPSSPKFYSCDEVDIIVKHPKSMEDVRVYDLSGSRVYKISKTMSDKSFKNKSYLGRKKFKSGTIRWVEINPDDVESRLSDNEFIKLHSLEKSSSKTNSGNKNSQTQKREKRIKLRTVLSNQQINKILDKLYKKYKNTDFVLSRDEVLQLGKKKSIWGNEVFNMYVSLAKTYPTLYGKENFVFAIDEGIFFHKGYPVIEYLQKDNSNVFSNPSLKTLNIKEIGNKITIKTAKQTILENVKNSKSRKLILELFEEFDKEFKISEEEKIAEFNFLTEKFIGNYNIIEHKVTYKLFKNRILWIETPIYDSKKRSTSVKEFPIENINDLKLGLLTLGGLYKPQLSLDRVLHNLSEEQLIEAKKIMTTINLIAQNNKKSSAEIKSIIDKVASRKVTIVENFVNEFDKNNNGKLDLLESNIFSDVLNKNQKLIIDKNPDYVHKFIRIYF
jgi:hypothetical protein